jgi:hypothetical protein
VARINLIRTGVLLGAGEYGGGGPCRGGRFVVPVGTVVIDDSPDFVQRDEVFVDRLVEADDLITGLARAVRFSSSHCPNTNVRHNYTIPMTAGDWCS